VSEPDPRYRTLVAGAPLAYVSDYVSFVGADSAGRVCFAIDTNRGYDEDPPRARKPAEPLQAETAFAVLHDELTGWVPQLGARRYPHPGPEVSTLPDSDFFAWSCTGDSGWTVRSRANDLELVIRPLTDRMVGSDPTTLFVMRTAAAVLTWRGRTIPGRVIHEGLASTGLNLLTRRSFRGLAGLQFLYLLAGDARQPAGDVYLQKTLAPRALAGLPAITGFAAPPDAPKGALTTVPGLSLDATAHAPALGFYRWPTRWQGRWAKAEPAALARDAQVSLRTISRTPIGQYGVAGVAMSIVEGTLISQDGTRTPLYGFAEILAAGPLMHRLASSTNASG
jgi:hypothetical protein